jgi:hypothetical protein
MHSLIYRTELLRDCGLELPKHTFYVDNLYVYQPLPHVENIYYVNVDFYRYFIGREDQSVNESVMIRRIDQQLKVNKLMIDMIDLPAIQNKNLQRYMSHQLEIVTVISSILLIRSGTKDEELYHKIRYGWMGYLTNLPGRLGRMISVGAYKVSQKLVGFN